MAAIAVDVMFVTAPAEPSGVHLGLARRVAARARAGTAFVVGVTGGVAAGKTHTAQMLAQLLRAGPGTPRVAVISADGFLYPNAELAARGLTECKGFPESFDTDALVAALVALRSGRSATIPGYSHLRYDVVAGVVVEPPDVVIVEGVNLLQVHPAGALLLPSDVIDLAIYLDAAEEDLRRWFGARLAALFEEARDVPDSLYHQWAGWGPAEVASFADAVWEGINLRNLREHIAPSRIRADVIVEHDRDHRASRVLERR